MPGEVPGDENASLILVMGITGAGKSYFVNKVAGKEIVAVGGSLDSCKSTHAPEPLRWSALHLRTSAPLRTAPFLASLTC